MITKGEDVMVLVDYDLFDLNVRECRGIYLKTGSTGKYLIYFPINQEWAELLPEQVTRSSPGLVPDENQKFVDRIEEL